MVWYRGTAFEEEFVYKAGGQPVDLSGKIVRFHFREENTPAPTATILGSASNSPTPTSHGSKLLITNVAGGTLRLIVTDEETLAISYDRGSWWFTVEEQGSGMPKRLIGQTLLILNP